MSSPGAPRLLYRRHYSYRSPDFVPHGAWLISAGGVKFLITPLEAQILLAVMLGPRPPDRQALTEILRPDPDLQPENAWNVIRVTVDKLNHILRPCGWELNKLTPRKGRGWVFREYLK